MHANQIVASHLIAKGEVYNLKNLADFAGTYFLLSGSVEETGSSKIRSDKNVTVTLKGWSKGPVVIQPGGSTIEFTTKNNSSIFKEKPPSGGFLWVSAIGQILPIYDQLYNMPQNG